MEEQLLLFDMEEQQDAGELEQAIQVGLKTRIASLAVTLIAGAISAHMVKSAGMDPITPAVRSLPVAYVAGVAAAATYTWYETGEIMSGPLKEHTLTYGGLVAGYLIGYLL